MCETIVKDIIAGRRLKPEDDLSFLLKEDLEELCRGADEIRKALCGSRVELCSIINGQSGRCSEDCKFCAQSSHHHTGASEYAFLPEEEILSDYRAHRDRGVRRYSIVTAGRALTGAQMEQALCIYRAMKACGGMELCASHGILSEVDFGRLKEAGVSRYHANIETSRRYFSHICTTHTFDDKIEVIRRARAAGLSVCSGGIIGMGETWEDRIDMAFELYRLQIPSIPINVLQPIEGTPFATLEPLGEDEILRTIAIFRYINPEASVRLAAGRNRMSESGKKAFCSGANAAITGNMLTTSGNPVLQDQHMLLRMGFDI